MRLALAQINTVVGDLDGNRERIVSRLHEAREAGADLVLFPELAVTGYPPEDLLFRPEFLRQARRSLDRIASETTDIGALVGFPWLERDLYNGCAICADGEVKAIYRSVSFPTTASSTRFATSSWDASSCCSRSARRWSARRSARTSGSRARLQPTSRSPAPT